MLKNDSIHLYRYLYIGFSLKFVVNLFWASTFILSYLNNYVSIGWQFA